jgi:hypothetical protein
LLLLCAVLLLVRAARTCCSNLAAVQAGADADCLCWAAECMFCAAAVVRVIGVSCFCSHCCCVCLCFDLLGRCNAVGSDSAAGCSLHGALSLIPQVSLSHLCLDLMAVQCFLSLVGWSFWRAKVLFEGILEYALFKDHHESCCCARCARLIGHERELTSVST